MTLVTFYTDTALSGGRGSPNAISPGSDGNNWTQQRGDQVPSLASNQLVFTYNSTSNLGVWTYGATSQTDQEVLVNAVQITADNEIIGAVVRCSDSTHFYYADLGNSSGNVEIGKRSGGSFTSLAVAPFSSSFGTKYSIRFQAIGSILKAKVWDSSTSEPTAWSIQWTDATLFAGLPGVCMAPAGSSSCNFDTFSATNGDTAVTNPVNPAYGVEQRGLVAGAVNADLVPGQDISAFEVWSLQIDAIASGATITFQACNDGINYVSVSAYNAAGALITSTTATGLFWGPRMYRYYKARQTAWTSGLTTGTLELYVSAGAFALALAITGTVTANAGTNLNTSGLALETGGNLASLLASLGAIGDTAWSLSGNSSGIAALKKIALLLNGGIDFGGCDYQIVAVSSSPTTVKGSAGVFFGAMVTTVGVSAVTIYDATSGNLIGQIPASAAVGFSVPVPACGVEFGTSLIVSGSATNPALTVFFN